MGILEEVDLRKDGRVIEENGRRKHVVPIALSRIRDDDDDVLLHLLA
jgi:hypothetical protein